MNPSKKHKKTSKMELLPNNEPEEDLDLKLENWENEGGAIVQSKKRNGSKEK